MLEWWGLKALKMRQSSAVGCGGATNGTYGTHGTYVSRRTIGQAAVSPDGGVIAH